MEHVYFRKKKLSFNSNIFELMFGNNILEEE
jgi:hypothetical protein